MPDRYPAIEDHAVVGDLHTVALVATDGTIDWCCLPRFDSPAVFASLLDADRGGCFAVRSEAVRTRQLYKPDTNVLVTRFLGIPARYWSAACGRYEAAGFMTWLEARCREAPADRGLQVLYAIDGHPEVPESVLDHLEGYKGSRPVRVGNSAAGQLQLDIYGELMDSVYLFNKYGRPIDYDLWEALGRQLDWLEKHWQLPDDGIWESRGGRHRSTYSAVMTWVAFERAIRIGRQRGLPALIAHWRDLANSSFEAVQRQGWSPDRRAYVQHLGGTTLDASLLVMPLVKFAGPSDPRFLSTLDRIGEKLASDNLVRRYEPDGSDGLPGSEGTFNLCSFWHVEALTRAGRIAEGQYVFETMLTYANHVGLFAEEIGPAGEALGNFPQAFTHLALISAACNLDRALSGESPITSTIKDL